MSIGFRLTTKSKSVSTFRKLLNVIAGRNCAAVNHEEDSSELTICRLGSMFFNYEMAGDEIAVSCECQTNLLGAGFHKAAIEIVDELVDLNGFPFEVDDDTEYYGHRDFERMRSEHFYNWLLNIMELCQERMGEDYKMLAICWDYNKYMPLEVEGTVVSPFGRIHLKRFLERANEEGIELLAKEFFMWNDEERDALFYRNSALGALWEDCCFMPSSRSEDEEEINAFIIENLEKAASMDASLPFPKEDYLLLCSLADKEPVDISALPDLVCDYPIGYRKDKVSYRLGNLSFALPGSFLYFEEEDSRGYYDDAEEAWHVVRISAFSVPEDEVNYMEDDENVLVKEISFMNGQCRLYDLGGDEEGGDEYVYQCQVITERQFSLFTISCGGEKEATSFCTDFIDHLTASIEDKNADGEAQEATDIQEDSEEYNPEMYEEEELDALETHVEKFFGHSDNIFHEIASPDIHVDIYIIEPTPEKNYYTLITTGMGARRMNVPEELSEYKLERAEVMVCLPADWDIYGQGEENYWPLRWLKILARLPIEQDTWLGWGHTVPNGGPFADNTKLSCVLLINPEDVEEGASVCQLPNGEEVNFYQMIPLYEEEMNFKLEHGAEVLLDRMDEVGVVVDINRKNVCTD
ncbi:MAG: suppressor of fused domain protein [Bacteroides sp.]|nr:suppressor of fused domain protein [Bacteroides sp.]